MAMVLTPKMIAKLAPGVKARDYWDSRRTGLGIRVFPSGVKSWTLRYRVGSRLRRMKLGDVRVLSLADARSSARDALKLVAAGHDPAEQKQAARTADTVSDFATTYIEKYAIGPDPLKPKKKSWKADRRMLDKQVLPAWRHRAMKQITSRDVRELLEKIAARAPIVSNRTRALLSKFFKVAIEREVVSVNPVLGTPRHGEERSRDRVLSPIELRKFWIASNALAPAMRAFYQLRLLTAARGGEVRDMRWGEVDVEQGWWTIPATSSKNKMPHRVWLSPPALTIVAALLAMAPPDETFVLEGARGKHQQTAAAATFKIDDFHGHDLRRTAATYMASAGVQRLVISKILNHVETGVTAVYDRASYDTDKQVALDNWARQLGAIVEQKPAAGVVPFKRGKGR